MKYRILTNGEKFIVQERHYFMWWNRYVERYGDLGQPNRLKIVEYDTLEEAKAIIEKSMKDDEQSNQTKNWRVIA